MDHDFLITVLKKYGFGASFIDWIVTILANQESCVLNGGNSTGYFPLSRGARQGDPISGYIFILVLEILFILIRENPDIEGIDIFGNVCKFTAFADDSSFFLKNKRSVKYLMQTFNNFSKYAGLNLNKSKCKIAGIGAKRGALVALCGMESIDLLSESVEVLGIHYSYNKKIQGIKNYLSIIEDMENTLKLWKMRSLTLIGKITIFKSLIFSKIVYLSFLTEVPKAVNETLCELQYDFLWEGKRAKIKQDTLIGSYENGGLKSVDINHKIEALQLSWIKRL